jgi:hypothetical protein
MACAVGDGELTPVEYVTFLGIGGGLDDEDGGVGEGEGRDDALRLEGAAVPVGNEAAAQSSASIDDQFAWLSERASQEAHVNAVATGRAEVLGVLRHADIDIKKRQRTGRTASIRVGANVSDATVRG